MSTSLTPHQKKALTVRDKLRQTIEASMDRYRKILPSWVEPGYLLQAAMNATASTPQLLDCNATSFMKALMVSTQLGLPPDGYHGHLIPFKKDVTFVPDYKGMVQVLLRAGLTVSAQVVYEHDTFEYTLGLEPTLVHKPAMSNRGKMVCAYAIAEFSDGRKTFHVATGEEIERRKNASYGSKKADSPWNKWPDEMWKKTAVKMLVKYLPRTSVSIATTIVDDYAEMGVAPEPEQIAAVQDIEESADVSPPGQSFGGQDLSEYVTALGEADSEDEVMEVFMSHVESRASNMDKEAYNKACEIRDARIELVK